MKRIAIVGCSGSGKSTLARFLGARLGLPVVHLDLLYWRASWRPVSAAEMRVAVDAASNEDRWIMDGLAIDASALRFTRADTIIWLDLPTMTCLHRVLWRAVKDHGRSRPDLPEGCPEKFDLRFYVWVARFRRDVRPRLEAAIDAFGANARVVRPANTKAVADVIGTLLLQREKQQAIGKTDNGEHG